MALYVGTNYYPHDWDEARWKADIGLMKEAGLTTVRLGHPAVEPADRLIFGCGTARKRPDRRPAGSVAGYAAFLFGRHRPLPDPAQPAHSGNRAGRLLFRQSLFRESRPRVRSAAVCGSAGGVLTERRYDRTLDLGAYESELIVAETA